MSVTEVFLVIGRAIPFAFSIYLVGIAVRALRSAAGSFRYRAGSAFMLLGAGLLLAQLDRVVLNSGATFVQVLMALGAAMAIVGCVRMILLVRTPDRRWSEIRALLFVSTAK